MRRSAAWSCSRGNWYERHQLAVCLELADHVVLVVRWRLVTDRPEPLRRRIPLPILMLPQRRDRRVVSFWVGRDGRSVTEVSTAAPIARFSVFWCWR